MVTTFDRWIASGAAGLVYAAVVFATHRWLNDARSLPITFATIGLVAAQVWLLGRTRGAVVALLIAAALNRFSVEIGGATVKPEHIAAPLVGLALLPDARRLIARLDRVDLFLLAWLVWSVVPGLLNAPDPANSTRLWAMLLLVAFGYFAVSLTIRTTGRAVMLFTVWLVIATGIGIWGLTTHLVYHGFGVDLGIQINPVTRDPSIPGPFHEANLFGSAVMMAGLAGIALLAFGGGPRRLAWAASIVGLLAVQVSFTRTAWIAFVGGLLLVAIGKLVYAPPKLPRRRPAGLLAFGLLVAVALVGTTILWGPFSHRPEADVAVVVTPTPLPAGEATPTLAGGATPPPAPTPPFLEEGTPVARPGWTPAAQEADITGRLGSIGDTSDSSVRLRLQFIRAALRDWREHPIVGLGIGSFGQEYVNSSNERAWLTMFAVRLLHDGGIIGVALFGAAVGILVVRVARMLRVPNGTNSERIALAMSVAIAAMFVAFLATEGLQLAWYWCTLGLFAALARLTNERSQRTSGR